MAHRRLQGTKGLLIALAASLLCLALTPSALAVPFHPRAEALDVSGLNHACGAAVDSKGDLYLSSAGESKIKVYDPSHALLTEISDSNTPCGLALTTTGDLYVSERATGNVVKLHPSEYPPTGATTYTETTIDASGKAKGIATDRSDNRLYVAAGDHVAIYKADGSFEANLGEGTLSEASALAAYTYPAPSSGTDRYLWVADAKGLEADRLYLFGGAEAKALKLRLPTLTGSTTPDGSFGFGAAGASLLADPGNRSAETIEAKCNKVGEQACTAGHLYLYDAAHKALDEFDASGEYLAQTRNAAFADAEPSALAIDRSGGAGDGTLYVSAGPGAGAKALAFGPLKAPQRAALGEPISKVLAGALAVTTDARGYVYVAAATQIHVYKPDGTELLRVVLNGKGEKEEKPLIEDTHKAWDLAVDSACNVYVLDRNAGIAKEAEATYYAPSACPPVAGTTYTRHEPVLATPKDFSTEKEEVLKAIAVDPGPGAGKDRLFLTSASVTHVYKSAVEGSGLLDAEFAKALGGLRQSIAVNGARGSVYFGINQGGPRIFVVGGPHGEETLARITESGGPAGPGGFNPLVAVDQSNGHAVEFDGARATTREYDASGSFVAEFGAFTEGISKLYRVAIDSACAIHEPPLSGEACKAFDPADGTVYVAFDDTKAPYDVTAFGRLSYPQAGEAPLALSGVADGFGPGSATLHGTVDPKGSLLEECEFEYLTESEYQQNLEEHPGDEEAAFEGAEAQECTESPAQIGEGTGEVAVHADVEGLADVPYRFRLFAKNAGGTGAGEAVLFGAPGIEALSPLPILYTEATLRAKVNPTGQPSEYRFEYLDAKSFEEQGGFEGPATHRSPWTALAAGEASVPVSAAITGLAEGTEYHYRAQAKNAAATVTESTQSFVTQARRGAEECANAEYRFGPSANLPDCRAYELVTPAETRGAQLGAPVRSISTSVGFNNQLTVPRGAGAGEAFSFMTSTTLPGFEGSGAADGYRSERDAAPHPEAGWSTQLVSPTYVQGGGSGNGAWALDGGPDQLYSFWAVLPKESFEGGLPEGNYLRTPEGFELAGKGSLGEDPAATSQYVSAGGAHVLFSSKAHLEEEAAPSGTVAIYDRKAGQASAEVVSLKPGGGSFGAGEGATYLGANEDGTAVVFKVGGVLYLHREGQTEEVAGGNPTYAGVSADGERVFYVKGSALWVFEAGTQTEIAEGGAATFVNVSADGSHAFFISTAALTLPGEENENGEHAKAGELNLYAWDGSSTHFIGLLDPQDLVEFGKDPATHLDKWTKAIVADSVNGAANSPARSTPDGQVFVFGSHARLGAYDNEGVGEIYRYAPAAPSGERLRCISCDPTGASPGGVDAVLENNTHTTDFESGLDEKTAIPNLTDDGEEVFFGSPDRLLPEDSNEVEDVYEWRAKGSGDPECTRPDGCLALISSGQGETASILYAMSADAHDVFFRTQEKLVGRDVVGSLSVYDARVGGGIPEATQKAPCQGDACQGNGTEAPAIPSSATVGSGETSVSPPTHCAKGKHRVKGRCVARKHKHKKHRHRANAKRGEKR